MKKNVFLIEWNSDAVHLSAHVELCRSQSGALVTWLLQGYVKDGQCMPNSKVYILPQAVIQVLYKTRIDRLKTKPKPKQMTKTAKKLLLYEDV